MSEQEAYYVGYRHRSSPGANREEIAWEMLRRQTGVSQEEVDEQQRALSPLPLETLRTASDPTIPFPSASKSQRPIKGNAFIGDPDRPRIVVAANGGSDLTYVVDEETKTISEVVSFLTQQDYVSGIFVDEGTEWGRVHRACCPNRALPQENSTQGEGVVLER